jgi:hypothetical protein
MPARAIQRVILFVGLLPLSCSASGIPQRKAPLKDVPTARLIEIVLAKQFYWPMHASNSIQSGFESLVDTVTLRELLRRRDAGDILLKKLAATEAGKPDHNLALQEKICAMEMLLAQHQVIEAMTKEQRRAAVKGALARFRARNGRHGGLFSILLAGRVLKIAKYPRFAPALKEAGMEEFLRAAPCQPENAAGIFARIESFSGQFVGEAR